MTYRTTTNWMIASINNDRFIYFINQVVLGVFIPFDELFSDIVRLRIKR